MEKHVQAMFGSKKTFLRNRSGQSMVEFAVCLPLLVLIFTGILFFGRGFIIGHRSIMAARYASWKFAKDPSAQEGTVKSTVRSTYQFDYELNNKKTDLGSGFSSGMSFVTSAGGGKKTTISIPYEPKYIAFNPGGINIGYALVVDGSTWTYEELGADNFIGVIVNQFLSGLKSFLGDAQSGKGDQYTQPPDDSRPSEQEP
jgi:hypothetical protein